MEWLILCLFVPAILVPVVLLWGFAGCDFPPGRVSDLSKPEGLIATAINRSEISLFWQSGDTRTLRYKIERAPEGGGFTTISDQVTDQNFQDTGLAEGTKYFYRVYALGDAPDSPASEASDTTFASAFTGVLATDQSALEGFCFVVRIPSAQLARSGTRVHLTLRGSTVADLKLDKVFISQAATSGNRWNSGDDLTEVSPGVTLPANTPDTLSVNYNLDRTMDLIVAFAFSPDPGLGNARFGPHPGVSQAVTYFKMPPMPGGAVQQASLTIRTSGFIESFTPTPPTFFLYLIEAIDVVP